MSKRRGLSLEEKRDRVMEIFRDTEDFFQLKDLEKIASKQKGISCGMQNPFKDILQTLIDDNLVDADKIGSSWYYWAFPSKVVATKKRKIRELTEANKVASDEIKSLEKQRKVVKQGREETDEREDKLKEMSLLQSQKEENQKQLSLNQYCNPEVFNQMKKCKQDCFESANRWTDNIFMVRSFASNRMNVEKKEFDKYFEIPEDFDYIEE
eukprot:GCRY01002225.1.p1 GENE.GCRY01002225.1~~GCRY01002225.1.p1  ORF type:complete len:210 (+),score=39.01 GCRY01002225.1:177-806(+)